MSESKKQIETMISNLKDLRSSLMKKLEDEVKTFEGIETENDLQALAMKLKNLENRWKT